MQTLNGVKKEVDGMSKSLEKDGKDEKKKMFEQISKTIISK